MSMEVDFSEPYLETIAIAPIPSSVPQYAKVSIAGRPYPVVNTSFEPYRRDAFRHRTIQAQREQIDLTNVPGEGTVNSEGLWRRSAIDWHYGAGQPYFDRKGSSDERFSTSKGVNPWMQWELSLLSDTKQVLADTHTTQVLQVGKYLYVLEVAGASGPSLRFTTDLVSYTSVTGLGGNVAMMATDGFNVWIITSTNVYSTTAGAGSAAVYVSGGGGQGIWWVGERLLVATGNVVSTVASGTDTRLWTHPNSDFVITAMCHGSSQIYISGYSAGQGSPLASAVYRTQIEPTDTALTVPVQAIPMEAGEYVTSLYGYLNYVFVGSNLGIRMCRSLAAYDPQGNEGDLVAGPLVPGLFPPGPVKAPVLSMVGNNRFLYFGWTNYDNVSTGLGRLDLATFIDTQAPAFASDLMVTTQGPVTSLELCTINGQPIFSIAGQGVYTATGTPVSSGYVTSGQIGYGIPDDKIVMAGDIGAVTPQPGTVQMALGADFDMPTLVGTQRTGQGTNQSPFNINQVRGELFDVQVTLTRDPVTHISPVLHRWTLHSLPAVVSGTTISVVLVMKREADNAGQDTFLDPYAELAFLESLRKTQSVVEYVEGPYTAQVVVEEIDWLPFNIRDDDPQGGYEGDMIVYLKTWDIPV